MVDPSINRVLRYSFVSGWRLRGLAIAVVGALSIVVGVVGSWWAAVALFVFAGLATVFALTAYRLATEVEALAVAPRPYVRFGEANVAGAAVVAIPRPWAAVQAASGVTAAVQGAGLFARIDVANDPPPGTVGAQAERVTGEVEFLDTDHRPLLRLQGRWAETRQRAQRDEMNLSYETVQLDIDANGLAHPLDIAMRTAQGACYAFNDDNSEWLDLEKPDHRLDGESFYVRVTLRGVNVEQMTETFRLTNNASGLSLAAEPK